MGKASVRQDYEKFIELIGGINEDPAQWPGSLDDLIDALNSDEVYTEDVASLIFSLLARVKELEDAIRAIREVADGAGVMEQDRGVVHLTDVGIETGRLHSIVDLADKDLQLNLVDTEED